MGGAGIDAGSRQGDGFRESGGEGSGVQRQGGVGEDDIALGAAIAVEDGFGDAGVLGDVAAEERLRRGAGEFEGFGREGKGDDLPVADFEGLGCAGGGYFVEAVFTVDYEAALEA